MQLLARGRWTERIISRGRRLLRYGEPVAFELGQLLIKARDHGLFDELCQELGLGRRKAYYLTSIAIGVEQKLFTPADIERIGWTKAQVLLPALARMNSAGRRKAISYAAEHNVLELRNFLDDTGQGSKSVVFKPTPKDAKLLRAKLVEFGAKLAPRGPGMVEREKALMSLVQAHTKLGASG